MTGGVNPDLIQLPIIEHTLTANRAAIRRGE
jgi:hypothetical protein